MFAPTRIAVDYFFLQEFIMILRMWHGYTAPQNADAYHAMLQETILPGLDRVSGYRGAYVARRHVENEVEFMTLTLWDSMDAVHAFSADGRAVIHKAAAPCSPTTTNTQFITMERLSLRKIFRSSQPQCRFPALSFDVILEQGFSRSVPPAIPLQTAIKRRQDNAMPGNRQSQQGIRSRRHAEPENPRSHG